MNNKDIEKQKADFLQRLDEEPPYEKQRFEENLQAGAGTLSEWAQLQNDGSIAVIVSQWLPDGTYAHGSSVVIESEDSYQDLRRIHQLNKPGDASTIIKKLVDGSWRMDSRPIPNTQMKRWNKQMHPQPIAITAEGQNSYKVRFLTEAGEVECGVTVQNVDMEELIFPLLVGDTTFLDTTNGDQAADLLRKSIFALHEARHFQDGAEEPTPTAEVRQSQSGPDISTRASAWR